MAGSGRSREAKVLTGTFVVGLIGGFILARGGGEEYGDKAHAEVDKYVTGQSFDRGGFELDILKGPVSKATLEAAVRGAYRQYGEDDAYDPSPEARAVVLCAGAAANALALSDEIRNNFIAGGRFEDQHENDAAEKAYTTAADGCQAALNDALNNDELVIPVDDK